jgi:uncharacterized protein
VTDITQETMAAPAGGDWKKNRFTRLFIYFFTIFALYAAGGISATAVGKHSPADLKNIVGLACVIVGIAVIFLVYRRLTRRFEGQVPQDLAAGGRTGGLIAGAIIGVAIISATIAGMWELGAAKLALGTPPTLPLNIVAMAIISGVAEEILFRGILFRVSEEMFGTLAALIVSSAFFGFAHIFNPNATVISSAAITIEAGLLLGFAYTATRSLWLPIGLHFGWNLAEGGIYSTAVSGGKIVHGVINTTMTGTDTITGGAFGPEASIVAVCVGSALTVVFAIVTFRRGHWVAMHRQIRAA